MKTHRLDYEVIKIQPPWDSFRFMEESWKGVKGEVARMFTTVADISTRTPKAVPYTMKQLIDMV